MGGRQGAHTGVPYTHTHTHIYIYTVFVLVLKGHEVHYTTLDSVLVRLGETDISSKGCELKVNP